MEENKQSREEKNDKVYKGLTYAVAFIAIVVAFFLCARICVLEKDIKNLQSQLEEMKLTLEVASGKETQNVITEPLPTNAPVGTEQVTVSGNDAVKQDATAEEVTMAEHKVYLTFDDGPSANTEAILDILDEYNVKATFFILGKEDEQSKERIRMIYERGHTIGMHSYSHVYSEIYSSLDSFKADFWKIRQYVFDVVGADCVYYRFPGGSSNTAGNMNMQEAVDFLAEQGVKYYDWNVISGDGSSRSLSKEEIVKNCTETISNYGTSIVLLHDAASKKETVEALPEVIETILAMEDTVILPITEDTTAIHHVIR